MNIFSEIIGLVKKADKIVDQQYQRLKKYIKHLLFPIYFFPIKLITYSIYYLFILVIKFLLSFARVIIDAFVFPFKSLKNLLKSLFIIAITIYMVASLFVILDYLRNQYGYYGKFLCTFGTNDRLKNSVVRIVGGYSEGSGFFISDNQVITNFHVIADEPSPKIILPDGRFVTPDKITGDSAADLALLTTVEKFPDLVMPLPDQYNILPDEPLLATGYPMGTEIAGKATILKGNFVDWRKSKRDVVSYIQTNISLVEGMSGGPLTDQCGNVTGVNTLGLAGLSMFISGDYVKRLAPKMTDSEITQIKVDPSQSPADAVEAFYTYLKTRRMEVGFELLSKEYLQKTNFEEWTTRFKDVLDVNIYQSKPYQNSKDTALVKFATKSWVDGEIDIHFYEGTWQTIEENGVFKMLKSKIVEVINPSYDWYYE